MRRRIHACHVAYEEEDTWAVPVIFVTQHHSDASFKAWG
jgi:hypothetical protein